VQCAGPHQTFSDLVDGAATTKGDLFEQFLHKFDPVALNLQLFELTLGCVSPFRTRAKTQEQRRQFLQGKSCVLPKADQRQAIQNVGSIHSVSVQAVRRREQPDVLVEADGRRQDSSPLRHFGNSHESQSRSRLTKSPLEVLA